MPAQSNRAVAKQAGIDFSAFLLVAVNATALAYAWRTHMSLRELLLVYWIQSAVIGATTIVRLLNLREPAALGSRVEAAFFFSLHYFGLFHFLFLFYIAKELRTGMLDALAGYGFLAAGFVLVQLVSLRRTLALDAAAKADVDGLSFLPYLRVLPMHATILFGDLRYGGAGTLVLFGALKTVVDVVMHGVEQYMLAAAAKGTPPEGSPRA
jgi:hypothetical protein